jgi:hypothetical protein
MHLYGLLTRSVYSPKVGCALAHAIFCIRYRRRKLMPNRLFAPAALLLILSLSTIFAGTYSGGNGQPATPYQISSPTDWQELMNTPTDWASHFLLTTDIDLDGIVLKTVGKYTRAFTGTFDGNNHVIRNAVINLPDGFNYIGLFGNIDNAQIKNLGVENAQITGPNSVGGLVGNMSFSSIDSCHFIGSVNGYLRIGGLIGSTNGDSITSCYASGTVSGYESVGGLVGANNCSIFLCSSSNFINGNDRIGGLVGWNSGTLTLCFATGAVSGAETIGGLAGQNSKNIYSCYTTGTVNGTKNIIGGLIGWNENANLFSCYTTGAISGVQSVGGLIAININGNANFCYATGDVSGDNIIGGLIGSNNNSSTIAECYAMGDVTGNNTIGGLVGLNNLGNVCNCYAAGTINGDSIVGGLTGKNAYGKIIRCYSIGKPTGNSDIGGLCGVIYSGNGSEDTGNFWDIDTSEITISAMGTGKTTAEMKTLATFTAAPASWDFLGESTNGTDDIWRMCADGVDYPKLTWQYVQNGDFACPDGVGLDDLARLSADWLLTYSAARYGADANADQTVNLLDFQILTDHWLTE